MRQLLLKYSLFYKIYLKIISLFPDELFLKSIYWLYFGRKLNLVNPQSFNEKIQWLKLHDRKPHYKVLVDKYEVKEYISNIIGKQYIIPTINVWDNADDINFDILPDKFVLKCTHDSGGVIICKNKSNLNIPHIKAQLNKRLKKNYYNGLREWPYKDVKPRIIAEKFLSDSDNSDIKDYKFFCFNGIVKFFKVDFNRFVDHHANYYTPKGELLPFGEASFPPSSEHKIILPTNLDKMIHLAERLSAGHNFLRVDFYDVAGQIYFGELTFFPASGLGKFTDDIWDIQLGEMLEIQTND